MVQFITRLLHDFSLAMIAGTMVTLLTGSQSTRLMFAVTMIMFVLYSCNHYKEMHEMNEA